MFVFICLLKDLNKQRKAWFWGGLWRLKEVGKVSFITKDCGDIVKFYCLPDSYTNLERHLKTWKIKHIKKHLPS